MKNKIYAGFGHDIYGLKNDLWVYGPQTAQWTQLEDCPNYKHASGISFVLGNRAFVTTGGTDSAKIASAQFWQYVR